MKLKHFALGMVLTAFNAQGAGAEESAMTVAFTGPDLLNTLGVFPNCAKPATAGKDKIYCDAFEAISRAREAANTKAESDFEASLGKNRQDSLKCVADAAIKPDPNQAILACVTAGDAVSTAAQRKTEALVAAFKTFSAQLYGIQTQYIQGGLVVRFVPVAPAPKP